MLDELERGIKNKQNETQAANARHKILNQDKQRSDSCCSKYSHYFLLIVFFILVVQW